MFHWRRRRSAHQLQTHWSSSENAFNQKISKILKAQKSFLRTIDRLFDTLNISSPKRRGWKAPINSSNYESTQEFFSSTKNWIINLKNSTGDRLIRTQRYLGFIGMWMNINTVQDLMVEFLSTKKWKCILTYQFSQDHLELLFNSIRRSGN